MSDWLSTAPGDAPLILAFPHVGSDLADVEEQFRSPWLARRDADWWVDQLYGFAAEMGATLIRTTISRSVIDLNRDPSGASLYPGQATTDLCPATTFDGDPLYTAAVPDEAEIVRRRARWFTPYHAALAAEIARLRALHPHIVLYDAHSIRSHVPRLFDGALPIFNIGTDGGATCDPALESAVAALCAASGHSHVVNGRFRGGWTTRHYGRPQQGVHAIQMELAMRGYLTEPDQPGPANWPTPIDPDPAILPTLRQIIAACIDFAKGRP
ncbi:N-formylglutamate deformylase [Sphingobium sp. Leaf26]|uniref:N-formylglutamate deformylase n=1 Tax=Sphingobium sp. Leaf26 TaxID=1735693 RepID=UPI0006FE0D87|nr:N-formylglutamate deformylase [Sphingobium sp. Leaf26]KQN04951.1 N-formylglutamate deformylase [Sphingobium sp. Leaf26]